MTRDSIREVLIRAVVRVEADGSVLDDEDHKMLVQFHTGNITRERLDAFTMAKAKRLDEQIVRRQ